MREEMEKERKNMLQSLSLPLSEDLCSELGGWNGLLHDLNSAGLDGVEGIWSGTDELTALPEKMLVGYHLTFFPDWLDMYRRNDAALKAKFGSIEAAERFYGGLGKEHLISIYRQDLSRAKALKAKYVVFHVSDVSLEEGYTYRWLHSDEEVIDCAAECVNELLDGEDRSFDFLLENQWWPGFTFTNPKLTRRMLSAVEWPRRGIMLDTGHLMNTNLSLKTELDGVDYILHMLNEHGKLCRFIKGLHLHQSLSGGYASAKLGSLPDSWPDDYTERFCASYEHILRLDRHEPWTESRAFEIIRRIEPMYLTHELSGTNLSARLAAAKKQMQALALGKISFQNGENTDVG